MEGHIKPSEEGDFQTANDVIDTLKLKMGIRYDKDVAEYLDVKSSDLGNWRRRGVIPNLYLMKLKNLINTNKEDNKMIDARQHIDQEEGTYKYIVELQKDKITSQENSIAILEEALKNKQAESTHWDALPYDFITDVTLVRKGFKFGRLVNSVNGLDRQSKVLGYSIEELEQLWDVGNTYKVLGEHPIDTIISQETKDEIDRQMKNLPYVFDSIKSMVGDHYIPQPLLYRHKDGSHVGAIAFSKVRWLELRVVAKVQFIVHMSSN